MAKAVSTGLSAALFSSVAEVLATESDGLGLKRFLRSEMVAAACMLSARSSTEVEGRKGGGSLFAAGSAMRMLTERGKLKDWGEVAAKAREGRVGDAGAGDSLEMDSSEGMEMSMPLCLRAAISV